ncbi:MAG: hypothetical protein MK209_03260 [Planctomycetes bacterium]|nr:hypothetical protein [Planctomycetota bacterium]
MFLSTILSALPLLNPALPAQEPDQKSCTKQESVAQNKIGKKAASTKVNVNRSKVTQQVQGKAAKKVSDNPGNSNKVKAQRAMRKTLQTYARGGSNRGVWKLAKIKPVNPNQVITWGVHEDDSSIAGLGRLGRNTGSRAVWGHHDDDSSISGLANATKEKVITWGQHDSTPSLNRLGQVTKNTTKKIKQTATQQKRVKKNKGPNQTRKNRKR